MSDQQPTSTSSKANSKPAIRRVPPPKFRQTISFTSQLDDDYLDLTTASNVTSSSDAQSSSGSRDAPGAASSTTTTRTTPNASTPKDPFRFISSLDALTLSSDKVSTLPARRSASPHHGASHSISILQSYPSASRTTPSSSTTHSPQHIVNLGPPSSTSSSSSSSASTRPQLGGRSTSGGARIAALANRFQSTASRVVTATAQTVQQTAAAAVSHGTSATSSSSSSSSHSHNNSNHNVNNTPLNERVGMASSSSSSDLRNARAIAGSLRDRGTNFVASAAAKFSRKGKDRDASGSASSSQNSRSVSNSSSHSTLGSADGSTDPGHPTSRSAYHSPEASHSSTFNGSSLPPSNNATTSQSLNRSASGKSKLIFGVRVPTGRAGEVFGAPIRVAADRTKLSNRPSGVQDLPAKYGLSADEMERRREACHVLPAIAIRCLDYLNEYGKTEEGLYRIPGSTQQVGNLRTVFDAGCDIDLLTTLSTREMEPSAVASCFKLWLRELPESLLHKLEREIDILLLEHTGNAASSKVTMAQPQTSSVATPSTPVLGAMSPNPQTAAQATTATSPVVVERVKSLFNASLPLENVIMLREIAYHLAHLDSFSSVTKMTFTNLRLILSPTLKLSPVMLALLVNERDQIFPKPGQLDLAAIHRRRPSELSFSFSSSIRGSQDLALSLPGSENALPPLPPIPDFSTTSRTRDASGSTDPSGYRAPYSSLDSNASSTPSDLSKRSSASLLNYRASWHVVDLPAPIDAKLSSNDAKTDQSHASTPIAHKFLMQRNLSKSSIHEYPETAPTGSTTTTAAATATTSPSAARESPPLTHSRTPSRGGVSPFFSSGGSPVGLGMTNSAARKRNSTSSIQSLTGRWAASSSNSTAPKSSSSSSTTTTGSKSSPSPPHPHQARHGPRIETTKADEEEELSSSDTSASVCSSTDSTATPKDSLELDDNGNGPDDGLLDSRRVTITTDTFGLSPAQAAEVRKKKRGSMMLMNLPDFSKMDPQQLGDDIFSLDDRRRVFEA